MILFLYVWRELVKYVLGTLVLCVFLFLLFDFMHKTTRYIPRYNPSSDLLIRAYLFQLPSLVLQALPISSLLGSVICMVLLSRTNELTAIRAAGVGPFHLAFPIVAGGSVLCGISFLLGEFVIPVTSKRLHYVQEVLIERSSEVDSGEGFRWVKTENGFFTFKEFDSLTAMLTDVRLIELGEGFRPRKNLDARLATFRPNYGDWLLEDIRISYFWPKGAVSFSDLRDVMAIRLPFEPSKFIKERRYPSEYSSSELFEAIRKGSVSGADVLGYRNELYHKIALYFAPLIVCLISLKFGYKSERVMETAKSVLVAVSIGMSYWFISSAFKAVGARGVVPPLLSACAANVIVLCFSVLNLIQERRD